MTGQFRVQKEHRSTAPSHATGKRKHVTFAKLGLRGRGPRRSRYAASEVTQHARHVARAVRQRHICAHGGKAWSPLCLVLHPAVRHCGTCIPQLARSHIINVGVGCLDFVREKSRTRRIQKCVRNGKGTWEGATYLEEPAKCHLYAQ
jgi:hypothetical protein